MKRLFFLLVIIVIYFINCSNSYHSQIVINPKFIDNIEKININFSNINLYTKVINLHNKKDSLEYEVNIKAYEKVSSYIAKYFGRKFNLKKSKSYNFISWYNDVNSDKLLLVIKLSGELNNEYHERPKNDILGGLFGKGDYTTSTYSLKANYSVYNSELKIIYFSKYIGYRNLSITKMAGSLFSGAVNNQKHEDKNKLLIEMLDKIACDFVINLELVNKY